MDEKILKKVEEKQYKKRPDVKVGDTVKLHTKIKEAGKERVQIFEGVVIAMKGSGLSKTLTTRKYSYGIGVERIIPLHSPTLDKIEIIKRGKVRRSKLYFMRKKIGKRALKVENIQDVYMSDEAEGQEEPKVATDENEKTEKVTDEAKATVEKVKSKEVAVEKKEKSK